MLWNWQQPDWPHFSWDSRVLAPMEDEFLLQTGACMGVLKHLGVDDRERTTIETLSTAAVATSEIEGEFLDRASVQSSIRKQLGLATDRRRVRPGEEGVAEMMVDLYRTFRAPLSEQMLFAWHRMLLKGRSDIREMGMYRTDPEPMQVVSGTSYGLRVHFEAPPSSRVPEEMVRFVEWCNASSGPALTRAGIAHLYFVSVHPFGDGNGRIGRAVAQKALAQARRDPAPINLDATILAKQKGYYAALQGASLQNEITAWLLWFADAALEAQRSTTANAEFLIQKTRLLDRLRGQLNQRQEKALLRMLREGPNGFEGGLSAANYASITGASPATTTRDLADLVNRGALIRRGELRHTRYRLAISPAESYLGR